MCPEDIPIDIGRIPLRSRNCQRIIIIIKYELNNWIKEWHLLKLPTFGLLFHSQVILHCWFASWVVRMFCCFFFVLFFFLFYTVLPRSVKYLSLQRCQFFPKFPYGQNFKPNSLIVIKSLKICKTIYYLYAFQKKILKKENSKK